MLSFFLILVIYFILLYFIVTSLFLLICFFVAYLINDVVAIWGNMKFESIVNGCKIMVNGIKNVLFMK